MSNHPRIFKVFSMKWCISLLILLLCWNSNNLSVLAQDDFMDDSTSDTDGSDATSDMMDTDPTQFKGPDLNQGGSNNAQNSKGKGGSGKNSKDNKDNDQKTIAEQTVQAALQFGVLVRFFQAYRKIECLKDRCIIINIKINY